MIPRMIFPITSGWVVKKLDAGFAAAGGGFAANVLVVPIRPDTFPPRLVTVRDDSGPINGAVATRRQGVNVWHTDPVGCEQLALLAMAILGSAADGLPVTSTSEFAGPFTIKDDPKPIAGGLNLTHFYFTFTLTVRATSF